MVLSAALGGSFAGKRAVALIFLLVSTGHWAVAETDERGSIYFENNGYRQILIGISDNVPEDTVLLDRIKDVFTKASAFLHEITKKRAFFEEIIVLIPKRWQNKLEYAPATNQTIHVSNIKVDWMKPEQRDRPFVYRDKPCGLPGLYMQLTPKYLADVTVAQQYGTYEKVIVHEWAHLRYGVFDEYPDGHEFYAAENGEIEGTRCSTALTGTFFNSVKKNEECNFENGLPDEFCQFKDDTEVSGNYGSLMYSHRLGHVVWFCDNDANSPNTLHNRQAPNAQNRNCDGRSVWEVLRSHHDFADGANPPRKVPSTVPTFRFLKYRAKRTVIVLDTSGSMKDNDKLQKLAQAVAIYILNVALDGDRIGIVWFNSVASTMSDLTEVNNSTRERLLGFIPRRANGGTSIGKGLLKAIEVLSLGGEDPAGGVILLVTDGEETTPPSVANVKDQITSRHIVVDAIAITENADDKIEQLAEATKGSIYYFSDRVGFNALNEALITVGQRGTEIRNRPIMLLSESFTIKGSDSYEEKFVIDSSIGRNTEFLIGQRSNDIIVEVTAPSGRRISRNDTEYSTDMLFSLVRIKIPGLAERGDWKIRIENSNLTDQSATITVISGAADQAYPIITTAAWVKTTVIFPEHQILYVSVSKGLSPVLEANVTATLERPNDSNGTAPPILLSVRDNGAGADVAKDDGIYSTYVTYLTDNGRYNVKVKVTASQGSVVVNNKIVGTGGSGADQRRRGRDTGYIERTEEFQRVTSAGSFKLQNFSKDIDAFPPGKVTDLMVTVEEGKEELRLSWTATGADLDQGIVSSYVLWKSKDFDTIYFNHWNGTRVQVNITPEAPGKEENYTIRVEETGNVTYYFALEAIDDGGNVSPRSNVASVSLKYVNDDVPHPNPSPNPSNSTLNLIVGCVVGSLVLIALVIAGIIVYRYRRLLGHWRFNSRTGPQQNGKEQDVKC